MSRRRRFALAGLLVAGFTLQIAAFPHFRLFGVQPDVVLVIAVLVAIEDGPVEGALVGFAGGLLVDMVGGQVVGAGAFTRAVSAFAAGMLRELLVTYSILLPLLLVFVLGLAEQFMYQVVLALLGQEPLPPIRLRYILPASLYDALLVFVLYPLVKRLRFIERADSQLLAGSGGSRL